jgi:hypothetical protein
MSNICIVISCSKCYHAFNNTIHSQRVTIIMHIAHDCVLSSSMIITVPHHTVEPYQQFISCMENQEAYLPVCYDLWWTGHLVGSIPFELKRSHCCLFCSSKPCQGARKAAVIGKWRQNSWTKHF